MRFETERLLVRDLEAADLEEALQIYLGNPGYLALTEGSAGEPGRYDLGMLERDYAVAGITAGRHFAGIRLRPTGELVGVLDWLDENPSDGLPWVGLLMIRADRQRQGLATEAFAGLARLLAEQGVRAVSAGVVEGNAIGLAFVDALGFRPVVGRERVFESPLG